MTRAKITYKVPSLSMGDQVEEFPKLRTLYGHVVANAIEFCTAQLKDERNQPSTQTVKHTLKVIKENPEKTDLSMLANQDRIALEVAAHELYGTWFLQSLPLEGLSACAELALRGYKGVNGRPLVDFWVCKMFKELNEAWNSSLCDVESKRLRDEAIEREFLASNSDETLTAELRHELTKDWKPSKNHIKELGRRRFAMFKAALLAVRVGASDKNIERLMQKSKAG